MQQVVLISDYVIFLLALPCWVQLYCTSCSRFKQGLQIGQKASMSGTAHAELHWSC